MTDVIVAGAGAAGLAAAYRLARAGLSVLVLEARERAGGRIFTAPNNESFVPFELGAEFVHGTKNVVLDLAEMAGWRAKPARAEQWIFTGSKLRPGKELYRGLGRAFEGVEMDGEDVSFDEYLRGQNLADEWFARLFVEGFDAADPARVSAQALAAAELSDEDGEDKDFRLQGGYGNLVDYLLAGMEAAGGRVQLGAVIQSVSWSEGAVEVVAQTKEGRLIARAAQLVVALPLGVLQAREGEAGAIRFAPGLREKEQALAALEMGSVVKMSFLFDDFFWKTEMGREDFGFIHAPGGTLKTWWPRGEAPILVGWTGGPGASGLDRERLLENALEDLRGMFGRGPEELRGRLRDWRFHDWSADPLAGGAYSYTRVGGLFAAEALAEPLAGTVFFAGEALAAGPAQGTVHGAVASGFRAADQALEAVCHFQS